MISSPLEQFNTVSVLELEFIWLILLNFNSVVLPLLVSNLFLLFMIMFFNSELKLIPTYWQTVFEKLYQFVLNILDQQTGLKGYVYFPLVFSVFFFILLCNLISMTPFGVALTSHFAVTLVLSLSLGLSVFFVGLLTHGVQFFKLFIPQCPFALLPMLIIIEMFSYIIRCFSLAIRLSANMIAGHTLVHIIAGALLSAMSIRIYFFFLLIAVIIAVLLLEIGVSFLQAYVFTILICIYLSDSLKNPIH